MSYVYVSISTTLLHRLSYVYVSISIVSLMLKFFLWQTLPKHTIYLILITILKREYSRRILSIVFVELKT
jgi:hypothetical protein